jgi:hypothetical protein
MADGFSPGHEVRERVAVGTWTAGPGPVVPDVCGGRRGAKRGTSGHVVLGPSLSGRDPTRPFDRQVASDRPSPASDEVTEFVVESEFTR